MKDKRVAVIGAGSVGKGWGNEKAAAVRLAREGARVLCVDRKEAAASETAELIRAEGGEAQVLCADVTDKAAGEIVMNAMQAHWGGVDVLDYNVGISQRGGVLETSDASWDQIFEINLTAAMRLTRAVLPAMRAQNGGAIIYVSSLAAVYSAPYSYVSYEVSKAALVRLARSVARENAQYGIRANSILPGMIATPHVNAYVDKETSPETLAAQRAAMVPMGRQGTAWDIANATLFLASDEANYITGVDLRVDGGLTA